MIIYCITGIDGAGKTTLAKKLVASLNQHGLGAIYIYGRTFPVISRLIISLGRSSILRKHSIWRNYSEYTAIKKRTMTNPVLRAIYTITVLMDYYLQIWVKLLIRSFGKRIIVLDRYIYDTIISDLAVHLNYSSAYTEEAIQRGLSILPRPDVVFLIDLPEEIAYARKDDIPHIDYLKERRAFYQMLEAWPEVVLIKGESPLETSINQMLQTAILAYGEEQPR